MQDKLKLKKLLDIVEELLKIDGNSWMVEDLLSRLNKAITDDKNSSLLNDIYEYCIEDVIKKQATDFYADFPCAEIRPILVNDYIRMERFRRQNNFEDFCMSLYQQIECITNTIIKDSSFKEIAKKLMNYPAYVNRKDEYERNLDNHFSVANLIFRKNFKEKKDKKISDLPAIDKIRVIMYFICYKGRMKNIDYNNFNEFGEIVYQLYQYRNKNHRGDVYSEYQINVFKKIDPLKSFYYLKFLTFLIFYIEGMKKGYPLDEKFVNYCNDLEVRR